MLSGASLVALLLGGAAILELSRQCDAIRHGWSDFGANLSISTDSPEQPTGTAFVGERHFHGPFVVAMYRLERQTVTEEGGLSWSPATIRQGSVVEFVPPIPPELRDVASRVAGTHSADQTRFVGQVSFRRELLWVLVALPSIATLWTGTRLAAITRRIRRFKKGLCTRCAYPLPLEDEEPRCPECGTQHIP